MIVSGLNENESQEREQGGIMWREIEFHLYRVHLLTLRFLGGNGAERFPPPRSPALLSDVFRCFPFFHRALCSFQSFLSRRVHILVPLCRFRGGSTRPFNISITLVRPLFLKKKNDTRLFDV